MIDRIGRICALTLALSTFIAPLLEAEVTRVRGRFVTPRFTTPWCGPSAATANVSCRTLSEDLPSWRGPRSYAVQPTSGWACSNTSPGAVYPLSHALVGIWDRDNGSIGNDDFLGYTVTDSDGRFFFEFDWDDDFPQFSESAPDLYARVYLRGVHAAGRGEDNPGNPDFAPVLSWKVTNRFTTGPNAGEDIVPALYFRSNVVNNAGPTGTGSSHNLRTMLFAESNATTATGGPRSACSVSNRIHAANVFKIVSHAFDRYRGRGFSNIARRCETLPAFCANRDYLLYAVGTMTAPTGFSGASSGNRSVVRTTLPRSGGTLNPAPVDILHHELGHQIVKLSRGVDNLPGGYTFNGSGVQLCDRCRNLFDPQDEGPVLVPTPVSGTICNLNPVTPAPGFTCSAMTVDQHFNDIFSSIDNTLIPEESSSSAMHEGWAEFWSAAMVSSKLYPRTGILSGALDGGIMLLDPGFCPWARCDTTPFGFQACNGTRSQPWLDAGFQFNGEGHEAAPAAIFWDLYDRGNDVQGPTADSRDFLLRDMVGAWDSTTGWNNGSVHRPDILDYGEGLEDATGSIGVATRVQTLAGIHCTARR